MTELKPNKAKHHRGRIFPERTLSPEELAVRKAEDEAFHQRCRAVFERVRPELIARQYGWYIAVEPNSEEYFIDADSMQAHRKALEKYPNIRHCVFCLDENGATGRM